MPDESDPPRKFHQLGKADFKRVNPEREAQSSEDTSAPDVASILRDNLARANAAGLNELALKPPRRSRRKRDYWLLLLAGNIFFGGALAYFGLHSVPGGFAFAGIIFFTTSLTWVMWLIVEDY